MIASSRTAPSSVPMFIIPPEPAVELLTIPPPPEEVSVPPERVMVPPGLFEIVVVELSEIAASDGH